MKRKFLSMLFTLLLITASLTGCQSNTSSDGSKDTEPPVASDDGPAASGDASDPETEDVTNEVVEITVWAWDASFNGYAMEEAQKVYGDGVKVNFVEMAKADCLQKLHTVLASGVTDDLPDIVLISDLNAQGYLMSYPGAFMAMDDYLNYNDFADYKVEAVSYDGAGYGIPFDTGVAALFYRTDYIEAAGYSADDMQNLTWDEYLELGRKLKEAGHLLQTYNPNDIAEFQIMLQSAGTWFTDDEGNPDFVNNKALLESYDIFKRLNESDFCKVVSDWGEFAGAINGGDVACVIRGSWISSTIMAEEEQSGLWAVAPVPSLSTDGATNKSNQGGSSWFVLSNGANAEAAARFMGATFAGSTALYDTMLAESNIVGTYLPASSVAAYDMAHEFYGGQKVNADLAQWLSEIPSVNVGAFSAEAQAALLGVTPDILNGRDLTACLEKAESQFLQSIQ